MARTTSMDKGCPTPQTHSKIKLRESCLACSGLITCVAREPKPVLTP
jgi:hypothetical protein